MANENLVSITVTRDTMTQDSGGGFTSGAPTTVYSGTAKEIVRAVPSEEARDEANAGIETISIRYFKLDRPVSFVSPATGFLVQDVVTVGGQVYRVKAIYEYARSIQLAAFWLH